MAAPRHLILFLVSVCFLLPSSSWASSLCAPPDLPFLEAIRSQCPPWLDRFSPAEVNEEILDRELGGRQGSDYYSVLFYASWCPFSRNIQPSFDALSTMFPQIRHLAVEESFATPSVYSRYKICSFPSIMLANRTMRVRYHGQKDLISLVKFYQTITGFTPVAYLADDQSSNSENLQPFWLWDGPMREMVAREPYLAFGLLFIFLKAFMRCFSLVVSRLKALCTFNAWHLNIGVLGESSQLLERVLYAFDVKRLWSKLRLCNKTGNFQKRAKNARVWASSLASVSLGESSSRSAPPIS